MHLNSFVQNLDSCKSQSMNGRACVYTTSDWTA